MTPETEYLDYLIDIRDNIEKIVRFTAGIEFDQFESDEKTIYAVIRALEIIGEASKKIPTHIKDRYPNIAWREMMGMRDKLIHDYIGVNIIVVWKTIQEDLPALKPSIDQTLIDMNLSGNEGS
jgi:uncharacterized protein with HEPN domain